ncbi:MAG TPA: peptidase M48, partial [Hyphomicrobium sp.]
MSPAVDGTASLGLTGIEIDLGTGQPKHLWRYAGLKVLEPIRPNAIDLLLSSRDAPGASLFVQGHDFATNLVGYAPHLSVRAIRWHRARQWLLLLALAIGIFFASYAVGWSPFKSFAGALPDSWRQRLGNAARESMTKGHKQC